VNRLKLWLYALIVLAAVAGLALQASTDLVARALDDVDASLRAAAERAASTQRLMAAEAAAVVQLAARDDAFARLAGEAAERAGPPPRGRRRPPPPTAAQRAARQAAFERAAQSAIQAAAKALAVSLPEGFGFAASNREAVAERLREGKGRVGRETGAFLREVASGKLRRATLRLEEALWLAVGTPAADGAAVALYLPFDDRWAKALAAATGTEVAIRADQVGHVGTVPAESILPAAVEATKAPGVVSVGSLPRLVPRVDLPVKIPPLPLLAIEAPARRAVAVPVEGVAKAFVILSLPTAPRLEPAVRLQWMALAGIAVALLLALAFGLWLRGEAPAQIPEALVEAAQRIEGGDLAARAPALAGRLGTIASALNATAEAAARAAVATPDTLGAPHAAPETSASAFEFPLRAGAAAPVPAPAAVLSTTSKLDGGDLLGDGFRAEPEPSFPAPPPRRAPAPAVASAPAPAPIAAPPPRTADGEEAEWQDVFQEFLRVRTECGEPAEGLTYDKFRVKLERNRDQLVQKYGCRSVRFQVYVKEGRAALKATPVR
jgi:hypothetical protein